MTNPPWPGTPGPTPLPPMAPATPAGPGRPRAHRPRQLRAVAMLMAVSAVLWLIVVLLVVHDLLTFPTIVDDAAATVGANAYDIQEVTSNNIAGDAIEIIFAAVGVIVAGLGAALSQLRSRAGTVFGSVAAGLQVVSCLGASCLGAVTSGDPSYTYALAVEARTVEDSTDPVWLAPTWAATATVLVGVSTAALLLALSRSARAYGAAGRPAPLAGPGYATGPGYGAGPSYGQPYGTPPPGHGQWYGGAVADYSVPADYQTGYQPGYAPGAAPPPLAGPGGPPPMGAGGPPFPGPGGPPPPPPSGAGDPGWAAPV